MRRVQHLKAFLYAGLLVLVLFSLFLTVSPTYAYWANSVSGSADTASGLVNNGIWKFTNQYVAAAEALETYSEQLLAQGNPYVDDMYVQTTTPSGATLTLNGLTLNGIEWRVTGTASGTSNNQQRRLGFAQLIDRSLYPNSTTKVFPIVPPAPATPDPYDYYNFFFADDVINTRTNNLYSLRLNYAVEMVTAVPIYNARNISFHAYTGLTAVGVDPTTLATGRALQVFVSLDGSTWTRVINNTIPGGTATSAAFSTFSYNLSSSYFNRDVYFRFTWAGGTVGTKTNSRYSRVVIENLTITTA
jgi:hypothetical protein